MTAETLRKAMAASTCFGKEVCQSHPCPCAEEIALATTTPAERYWEARWRDEAAENDGLRTKLKAAEYAAKVNYDGWQQELARKGGKAALPVYADPNFKYNEATGSYERIKGDK
jgi:hypothetical protein